MATSHTCRSSRPGTQNSSIPVLNWTQGCPMKQEGMEGG